MQTTTTKIVSYLASLEGKPFPMIGNPIRPSAKDSDDSSLRSLLSSAYNQVSAQAASYLQVSLKGVPIPPAPFQVPGEVIIFSSIGATFMSFSIMIIFVMTVYAIVTEKSKVNALSGGGGGAGGGVNESGLTQRASYRN